MANFYITLAVIGVLLLPMWIGVIARLFVRNLARHELAGLISLPFLALLEIKAEKIRDLSEDILKLSDYGVPTPFSVITQIVSLVFGVLLLFVILRGVSGWGIRIVDACRKQKNRKWISCSP